MKSNRTVNGNGAIEYVNERGYLHREDGPAVEIPNRHKAWYINGELHREDGPAKIFSDGEGWYYLNDVFYYSVDEWKQELLSRRLKRLIEL